MGWSARDLPDLDGRTVIVTGANSGLGLETARELAGVGARVLMACRNAEKAEQAKADVLNTHPSAQLSIESLDLASLASVRDFAKRFNAEHERLDLLINNAGVMALPRCETADGFEMQFGTNHLGHFALTGLLLPRLLTRRDSRVVTVSSIAHRSGRMRWDDLQGERFYMRWLAYGQSKLSNLLFAFELSRRLEARGAGCLSLAAHPGMSATELQFQGARMERSSWKEAGMQWVNQFFAQSAAMGALPTLYAAASPEARSADYIGPDGFAEAWGHPKKVSTTAAARNAANAKRLWEVSEELTGVRPFAD